MKHVILSGFVASLLLVDVAFAQVGQNDALLYADTATQDELTALPHMTAALAEAVIAKRPFASATAFDEAIADLTAEQRKDLYGRVFLPINLNTASEAEIMLIPGMTGRMAHEFEEYRPYTSLEQFRREIGKYVDDDEVARLEQYVFVPLDLNTASEEALATIPGMSRRMVHEFEEYRPYTSLDQFRREIGKYVDDDEVARFERYVTLN